MKTPIAKLKTYALRTLRVSAYLGCVSIVVGAVGVRAAYGEAKKRAMVLGDELAQLTTNEAAGEVSTLRVNGEAIHVASATTSTPFGEIVDRLEKACREHADGLTPAFADLAAAMQPGVALPALGGPGAGVVREVHGDKGLVFCFAAGRPEDPAGLSGSRDFVSRLQAFSRSADLGDVGRVRYSTVRSVGTKDKPLTQVIAIWTDEHFSMRSAFPTKGDAPGSDADHVVRLPDSRRLLTAASDGAPYSVRAYEASMPIDRALSTFDTEMPKLGWTAEPEASRKVQGSRAFRRGGVEVLVTATVREDSTRLSVVEMGKRQP
ncbi:MAG: hypothetical protein ACHREM_07965 [Polyangiales bacterium]